MTARKTIRIICGINLLELVYVVFKNANSIYSTLRDPLGWGISEFLMFALTFIYLPLTIILFWQETKIGWSLLFFNSTVPLIGLIADLLAYIKQKFVNPDSFTDHHVGIDQLPEFVIFTGFLWVINTLKIRDYLGISKPRMLTTLLIPCSLGVLMWVFVFLM